MAPSRQGISAKDKSSRVKYIQANAYGKTRIKTCLCRVHGTHAPASRNRNRSRSLRARGTVSRGEYRPHISANDRHGGVPVDRGKGPTHALLARKARAAASAPPLHPWIVYLNVTLAGAADGNKRPP